MKISKAAILTAHKEGIEHGKRMRKDRKRGERPRGFDGARGCLRNGNCSL